MSARVNPQDILRKAARSSRRSRASGPLGTQRALVDVAVNLFATKGYAAASLDEIVAGAQVTKGALYHHFSGKQALFEAAFEKVEFEALSRVKRAIKSSKEPWDQIQAALKAFFEVFRDEEYRRIVVQEGPAVLGYERYREQEERSTMAVVHELVHRVLPRGLIPSDLYEPLAHLVMGAMSNAASQASSADDPAKASADLERVVDFLLSALRAQLDPTASGVEPADSASATE